MSRITITTGLVAISFSLFFACRSERGIETETTFSDENFDSENTFYVKADHLNISSYLGMPYEIMVKDSFLWVMDGAFDNMLTVFNLNTRRLQDTIGKKGNGLGELAGPWSFIAGNQDALTYVYDLTGRKINVYKYIGDRWQFQDQINARTPQIFRSTFWLNDSVFLASTDDLQGRLGFYNIKSGKLNIASYTLPPKFIPGVSDQIHAELSKGNIAFSKDQKKVAIAMTYADRIDLYDISEGRQEHVIIGPNGHLPSFKTDITDGYENVSWRKDNRYGFINIFCTNEYVAGLYSGRSYDTHDDYDNYGNTLYIFDWQGNPSKKIVLDVDLLDIYFDESQRIIYGICSDKLQDGGDVVIIKLNEII